MAQSNICLVFYTQSVLAGDFLVDFFAHVRSRRLKASRLRRLRLSRLVEQNESIVPSPPEILSLQMILQLFLKSAAPSRCKRMQTHAGLLRRLPHQASTHSGLRARISSRRLFQESMNQENFHWK